MSVTQRSVASTARRAQIIEATIAVVADEGFARASFGRIAERAGLSSTRLISYHFAGKDELVGAVVAHVIGAIGTYVGERVRRETTPSGRLRAYITSTVEFADEHRAEMRALLQVVLSGAWDGTPSGPPVTGHLEEMLLAGQRAGEMRPFDVRVMAATVQRAVEGVPFQLQSEPDLDCAAYAVELVDLFDRATAVRTGDEP